jgi:hypothetical protein
VEGVQRLGGVGDAGLALAVVAEAGHLEDGRVEAGRRRGDVGVHVDDREGAVGQAVVAQEALFGDAVLAHRHRRGAGRTGTNLAR